MEYIRKNEVNRLELVRRLAFPLFLVLKLLPQLQGAAEGLEYLHGASLIHGDLKGVGICSFHDRFLSLISKRRTYSCPTTRLLVLASRTLVS